MRLWTDTLSAASVRGVTVPVAARPWRTWKRLTASASVIVIGTGRLVGGEIAADDQALAQQFVMGALVPVANFASEGIAGHPPRTAISE